MSDSGGGGGSQLAEEVKDTALEVASDIKDSVGEAIEQGVQSVVGTPLTPQQIQAKQQEDQNNLVKVRRQIAWMKNVDQSQKQVRQENIQKEQQKQQVAHQEKVEKVQITQQVAQSKNDQAAEAQRRAAAELKAGKGVGG